MMFTDYGQILNRDRSDLSAARSESNYSIYSINGGSEGRPRGISELGCLVSTPWTHKSFIDKRRLTSQAGRRGFEPHLPLHLFNNLHQPASVCAPFVLRLHDLETFL